MSNLDSVFDLISKNIQSGEKLKNLGYILEEYDGDDWKQFCSYCNEKYKRNLVKKDSNIEMLVLCWDDNQQSNIHSHPENGCIVKVLSGSIKEEVYRKFGEEMELTECNIPSNNDIMYQEGNDGLHKITNISDGKTVTLHVYSPPDYKPIFY